MSWAIEITGTKKAVAKKVIEQLDKIAAGYAGKEERQRRARRERAHPFDHRRDVAPVRSKATIGTPST